MVTSSSKIADGAFLCGKDAFDRAPPERAPRDIEHLSVESRSGGGYMGQLTQPIAVSARQSRMPSLWTRISSTCAVEPSRRSCRSRRMPLVMASATISDATPAATPAIEMAVMTADHRLSPLGPQVSRRNEEFKAHVSQAFLGLLQFNMQAGTSAQRSLRDEPLSRRSYTRTVSMCSRAGGTVFSSVGKGARKS